MCRKEIKCLEPSLQFSLQVSSSSSLPLPFALLKGARMPNAQSQCQRCSQMFTPIVPTGPIPQTFDVREQRLCDNCLSSMDAVLGSDRAKRFLEKLTRRYRDNQGE